MAKDLAQKIERLEAGLDVRLSQLAGLENELKADAKLLADLEEKMVDLRAAILLISGKIKEIEEKLVFLRRDEATKRRKELTKGC